jgi:NADH-quinone oxidoreductase subunit A
MEVYPVSEFGRILLFIIGAGLFSVLLALFSRLVAPHRPGAEKETTYESGEAPEGPVIVQFNSRFYVVGLIFLLFDVEILFLFPWATVFARTDLMREVPGWGWIALAEAGAFVGILALGLAYAWVRGDLAWIKPDPILPTVNHTPPQELYDKVNERYTYKGGPANGST